jgi:cyclic pyranopterin phosphate synthase
MPPEGVPLCSHQEILTFEEIVAVVKVAVKWGITKVRLTGGEPLVRRDIVKLVAMVGAIPGILDYGMTTNGILLADYAHELKNAGLQRVNISLDSVEPERYREITRGGDFAKVMAGIKAATEVGLNPVKINTVQGRMAAEPVDVEKVKAFCDRHGLEHRVINKMNLQEGIFSIVEGGTGGDCLKCNRLRLSAQGMLYPCLFSDIGYQVRNLGIQQALDMAVKHKPASGTVNNNGKFYQMGG